MEKGMEHILALFAPCHLTAVFSKQQLRHVTTPNISQIDLSTTVILSRNPNGRASDIFHYAILPEQFLPVAVHHDISGGNLNSTWLRVSPHSRDRMADFRWPEKALSTRTKGQPGEHLVV